MIIDFHTHAFPDKIAQKAMAKLEQNIIDIQGRDYPPVGDGTLGSLKKIMKRDGVDVSVVMPIATTVRQSASINRFAKEINGRDGIISFGGLHPMQNDWERVLEEIKESGLRGIKLHLEYQGVYVTAPEILRLLKKAEELELYTMFHSGRDVGMPEPVHCTPRDLSRVLDFVGGKYIIAAHMGGWRLWDDVEKYLVGTPIMLDVSYVKGFMDPEQFKRIIKNHGSEKILFASDMPWQSPRDAADMLEAANLSPKELENIYYGNAAKILGICNIKKL